MGEQSGAFIGLALGLEYGNGHEHDRLVQTLIRALRLVGMQELRMVMTILLLHSWVTSGHEQGVPFMVCIHGRDRFGVVGVGVLVRLAFQGWARFGVL